MEGGPPSFTRSSTSSVLLWNAGSNAGLSLVHTGLSPSMVGLSRHILLAIPKLVSAPTTPESKLSGLGYVRFRSPLLTESRLISFPAGTEMFQFSALASHGLCVQPWMIRSGCPALTGCPIRKSRDCRLLDTCPGLIAAYHVLHRLSTPRHPPYTLSNLTISIKD